MAKPVINTNVRIEELFIQKFERYLPTAFDGSMSILEKMNKIIEYMNSIGATVNGAFEQWNEIMEWVMNDGLNEAVINQLNEMILDGTMDTIINQNVLGSRAEIIVDTESPINPDEQTFWFRDMGSNPSLAWGGTLVVDESQVIYEEVE